MKRIIYLILTIVLPLFIFSCKKDGLENFGDRNALYFDGISETSTLDSTDINFSAGADDKKDSIVKVPILLMGRQLTSAAPYEIYIDPSSTATAGVDYEWKGNQFSFPAGVSSDTLLLKVLRSSRMLSSKLSMKLEIRPSAKFDIQLLTREDKRKGLTINLYLSDIPMPPDGWVTTPQLRGYDYYFGTYSKKKLSTTVLASGYAEDDILYFLPLGYSGFFADRLVAYLNRMKAAGTPVLETDGSEMKVGPYYL